MGRRAGVAARKPPLASGETRPAAPEPLIAQDLRLLDRWIERAAWPAVDCPACGDGRLAPDGLTAVESAESAKWHGHDNWEPDMVRGGFHGLLRCAPPGCGEPVVVAGDYEVQSVRAPNGGSPRNGSSATAPRPAASGRA